MNKLLLLVLVFLGSTSLYAQDFPFGEVDRDALSMKRYSPDTNAAAVVIKEFGTARISNEGGNTLIFEYHVRIKVFNSARFEGSDVVIPLYKSSKESFEKIDNVKGLVYHQNPNGGISRTELSSKDIFRENATNYLDLAKFAMPAVTDGSIVEYAYRIESPYLFNFRAWEFQTDLPKIYSEYIALIPASFSYNVSLVGPHPLSDTKSAIVRDCFQPGGGYKADCSKMTYIMKDIPALIEEAYMTSPKNFRSAINFELSEVALFTGGKRKITREWSDIDYDLKKHSDFGRQIRKESFFEPFLDVALAGKSDPLEKAKAVYRMIQQRFKWNSYLGMYSEMGIKKAFENRTGNIGDINLSLVSALEGAGLDVEAVVLSTRDNGFVNKLYPVISNFDYVIAKVNIGEESYLLDASDPLLPFGLLPVRCLNDQGRVISMKNASYWIDLKASQKRSSVYSVILALNPDGKITGTLTNFSRGYEAFAKRKKMKEFNSLEEFVEHLDEKNPSIKILDYKISNLDSLEASLTEVYTVEMDGYDHLEKEMIFLNPFFMDRITENPFKLAERTYPVDMGAPLDSRITITLSFPEEFEIVSRPEDKRLALPNKGGRFLSSVIVSGNQLTYAQATELDKSIYDSEEYHYLKELYNQIILLQKTDIVFKRKK